MKTFLTPQSYKGVIIQQSNSTEEQPQEKMKSYHSTLMKEVL